MIFYHYHKKCRRHPLLDIVDVPVAKAILSHYEILHIDNSMVVHSLVEYLHLLLQLKTILMYSLLMDVVISE